MTDFATLAIRVDSNQAIQNVNVFINSLDVMEKKGTSSVDRLTSAFVGLGAATKLMALGDKFVKETTESQRAMAQLEAVVKSTGGVAGFTAQQLASFAGEMQNLTTFTDEAVMSAESLLLTFGNIRGSTVTEATKAVANLATALGEDLHGAAIQVGKALNDPTQGLTALRKAGVSFSESQQQVIKDLFATGHQAEAQGLILKELEKEFGGSAAAARDTLGGALKALGNDFGELFEISKSASSGLIGFLNTLDGGLKRLKDHQAAIVGLSVALGVAGLAGAIIAMIPLVASLTAAFAALDIALLPLAGVVAAIAVAVGTLTYGYMKHKEASQQVVSQTKDEVTQWREWIAVHQAAKDAADAVAAAVKAVTFEQGLELNKLIALNAAHGQSALALGELALKYDAITDKAKFLKGHTAEQIAAFDGLTDAITRQKDVALIMATADAAMADAASAVAKANDRLGSSFSTLRAAIRELTPDLNAYNAAVLGAQLKAVQFTITPAKLPTGIDPAYQAFLDSKKYVDDIQKIWADGYEKIATDGTKSFHDFFEDVFQMFSKLMARMQQAGQASGFGFGALKAGSAALGAGLAGYGIGSSVGSAAGGVGAGSLLTAGSSGATAGALAGSVILPGIGTAIGAIVGELTGVAGALISGAKAAKERKDTEDQLRTSLLTSVNAMRVLAGVASPLSQSLLENAAAFKKLRDDNDAAFAGTKNQAQRESQLGEINGLEAIRIQQLKDEAAALHGSFMNDLEVRNLRAHGMSAEADAMADTIARGKELSDAIKQFGASSEEVAKLMAVQAMEMNNAAFAAFSGKNQSAFAANLQAMNDQIAADNQARAEQKQLLQDQLDVANEQLDVVTKSLTLQQKAVDSLRATVDALHKQTDSLRLSNLSPLSANDRYLEAARQYNLLATEVAAGDQSKISEFTAAQTAWLTESRAMFGSSGRYEQDFKQAEIFNATLTDHFQTQLSTEEQILSVLQHQSDQLNAQIALLAASIQQSAYDAALSRQTYIRGAPGDPNFMAENASNSAAFPVGLTGGNGSGGLPLPGTVTYPAGLNPWDPNSPTGQALARAMGMNSAPHDKSMAAYTAWIAKVNGDSGRSADWGTPYDQWLAQGSPSFARGGTFRGGVMQVHPGELIQTGPARVTNSEQLNAPTVARLEVMIAQLGQLLGATRENTSAVKKNKPSELAGSRR